MKKHRFFLICFLLMANCLTLVAQEQAKQSQHGLPGFEENRGQLLSDQNEPVPYVFFKAHTPGMDVYLTNTGITYVLVFNEHDHASKDHSHASSSEEKIEFTRIDMQLVNASITRAQIQFEQPLPGHYNYYLHHCPKGITNVQRYSNVIVKDIYPGIDWLWHIDAASQLKYDFVVHPGASPETIRMLYKWADVNVLNEGGGILLKTPHGQLQEGEIKSFCNQAPVGSRFSVNGNEVSIVTSAWDKQHDLIIDPPLTLLWGTYIGGGSWEKVTDIDHDIDGAGNNFIACNTLSSTFPTLNPGGGAYFQGTNAGPNFNIQGKGGDVGIMKFSNSGALLWSTYYGGSADDNGNGIRCDAAGNIYVTGNTESTNFPLQTLAGAFNQPFQGASDAFLLKFDNNGVLLWGTHIGGGWDDVAYGIEVDPSNNILITGQTGSANFPVMSASVAFFQGAISGSVDMFIMRFNAAGAQTWGTFVGGSQSELGNFIISDNAGKIYVTGSTTSNNFPTFDPGGGAYYEATFQGNGPSILPYRGDWGDAIIMRFANTGALEWSTYYGGTDSDAGRCIAIKNNGDIYVTGDTRSASSFPLQNGGGTSYNQPPAGLCDAFYLRFNAQCQRTWATLFGGTDDEYSGAITIDACGNVYGTGHSYSLNMPTVNPGNGAFFVSNNLAADDVYFLQFDAQNALTWATYNGTTGFDEKGTSIEIDPNGNVFAVGWWCFYSTSNGVMNPGNGAYYKTNIDADDFFIIKFEGASGGQTTAAVNGTNNQCNGDCNGTAFATVSGSCQPPFSYFWLPTGDTTASISGLCAGTYSVIVTDAAGISDTVSITISQPAPASASVTGNLIIEIGDSTTLTAIGGGTYLWSNGDTTASIVVAPTQTTSYSVIVYDNNGCPDTVSVTVIAELNCVTSADDLLVPNVFTPNGDGINDLFEVPFDPDCIIGLQIDVWDRWGWQVHYGAQMINSWDGRYRNDNRYVTEGVYYYIVRITTASGDFIEKNGFVHVTNPMR